MKQILVNLLIILGGTVCLIAILITALTMLPILQEILEKLIEIQ